MSVWLTIPSARPVEEVAPVLAKWRQRGYKIALWCDFDDGASPGSDLTMWGKYPGYAGAVNQLIRSAIDADPEAEWFIAAGDDVLPDPNHTAEEIAAQCRFRFYNALIGPWTETFGVMQPTGDRWGEPERPGRPARAYIDHVCGSAWIGREFAKRAYGGNGPLWHEYFHMFVDEELHKVATKFGVLWQRPDLTQHHQHWGRPREGERYGLASRMPDFLRKANSADEWNKGKAILQAREAAGFPGSELLG
jgi:hypothetical protein